MKSSDTDTIAAIATAAGRGGIGIVRVSGPDAGIVAEALLGRCPVPRVATYAKFLDAAGEVIDEGLALWFPAPHSFTGQDVLELQGHGGPVVLQLLAEVQILGVLHHQAGRVLLAVTRQTLVVQATMAVLVAAQVLSVRREQ